MAAHWEMDLTITQPAPVSQTSYRVERKYGATGPWGTLTTVNSTLATTKVTDPGPYTDGQVIGWRVFAIGPGGTSPASAELIEGAPTQLPGAPTVVGQWRFLPA